MRAPSRNACIVRCAAPKNDVGNHEENQDTAKQQMMMQTYPGRRQALAGAGVGLEITANEYTDVIETTDRELSADAWIHSGYLPYIPAVIDFTGKVGISADRKCFKANVIKTMQLNFAIKKHLHIIIAYRLQADFPRGIIGQGKEWMRGLPMSQRRVFLRKWGTRSNTIEGTN